MKIKLMISVLFFLVLSGCINYYPNLLDNYNEFIAIKDSLELVKIEAMRQDATKPRIQFSAGMPLGDGYMLVPAHALTLPDHQHIRGPMGMMFTIPLVFVSQKITVGDFEATVVGMEGDIAVLYIEGYKEKFRIPFGDSDKLEVGTEITICGRSHGINKNLKFGVVAETDVSKKYFSLDEKLIGNYYGKSILVTAPINPGDSGSPMLAFKNGHYEVVGMVAYKLLRSE